MTDCYFTGISKQLITVSSSLKILGAFQKSLFLSQRNTSQSKKSRYKSMLEYPVQRFNIQISSIHTRNIYFSFTDYTKAFDFVGHSKLGNSSRDGNTGPPYSLLEKPVNRSKKQQLELDMEQQTGSKLEKEYIKAVYCHPAHLTYMQSAS